MYIFIYIYVYITSRLDRIILHHDVVQCHISLCSVIWYDIVWYAMIHYNTAEYRGIQFHIGFKPLTWRRMQIHLRRVSHLPGSTNPRAQTVHAISWQHVFILQRRLEQGNTHLHILETTLNLKHQHVHHTLKMCQHPTTLKALPVLSWWFSIFSWKPSIL